MRRHDEAPRLKPATDPVATALEALCIVALCFGLFILNSLWSVSAGFRSDAITDTSLLGIVMMEAVFGTLALVVLRQRGYALVNRAGFELTPRSWTNFKGFHEKVQNGVQARGRPEQMFVRIKGVTAVQSVEA